MNTVEEIEKAIEELDDVDLLKLWDRFSSRAGDAWDRQVERDSASGALDAILDRVAAEHRAGATLRFPTDDDHEKPDEP